MMFHERGMQALQALEEIDAVIVQAPFPPAEGVQGGGDHGQGVSPQKHELGVRKQLHDFIDDEVIARRLVEEVQDVRLGVAAIQVLDEAPEFLVIGFAPAGHVGDELRHRVVGREMAVFGIAALPAQGIRQRQQQPGFGGGADPWVGGDAALQQGRSGSGQGKHEQRGEVGVHRKFLSRN